MMLTCNYIFENSPKLGIIDLSSTVEAMSPTRIIKGLDDDY